MTLRGILLDFYGTLVHEDDEVIPLICDEVRRTSSVETTSKAIGHYWWSVFSPLCDRSFGPGFLSQRDVARESLSDTIRHFGSSADLEVTLSPQFAHWQTSPTFTDTTPFLGFLREAGLPVCVVSNIDRSDVEACIAHHRMTFDTLVTSDDARAYKPRPEMFRLGLASLGLRPNEVLHVGDSRRADVAGARALSIPVAWLDRRGRPDDGTLSADYVVQDLESLSQIVRHRLDL